MKRVLGLFVVLGISVGAGLLYWSNTTFKAQDVPQSYKVLDDLETKGIFQGEEILFEDLEGKVIPLESLRGKAIILSFWATWCEPCVEEFPSFLKLLDEFPEKVVLVAISHDYEKKDVRDFVEAFEGYRKNMILTMDPNKALSRAFAVDRLPEGFVFNSEGKLVKKIIGIQDWASPSAIEFFRAM